MSNRELPMMPWFPQDFAGATSGWTVAERALYRELLDAEWILGKLPMQPERLARIARFDLETFKEAWQVVSTKFDDVSGCLLNKRLEEHRASAQAFAEQKLAAARAGGLARAKQMQSHRSATAEPGGSYPSPSPSPSKNTHPNPSRASHRKGRRADGTNPRATGTNPRVNGKNPRALGTNPRTIEQQSLTGWRCIGGLTDYVKDSNPPLTWAYIAEHCADPVAIRAAEKIGYRVIADRDKFTTKDIQARFREAYESELERVSS